MLSLNKSYKNRKVSLTIHCRYKYFDSTVHRAEDRRQKFYFCRLPFDVNVKLNLSNEQIFPAVNLEIASCGYFLSREASGDKYLWVATDNDETVVKSIYQTISKITRKNRLNRPTKRLWQVLSLTHCV